MWTRIGLALGLLLSGVAPAFADGYVETTGTYAEGAQLRGDRFDTGGNLKTTLGTCLSGESNCVGTSPNSYIMTTDGVVRSYQILGTGGIPTTATDATTSVFTLPNGPKNFQGIATCTGTCVQTQKIYGTSQNNTTVATAALLCTISLNDTTATEYSCTVTTDWLYYFVVTSATSGTTPLSSLIAHY